MSTQHDPKGLGRIVVAAAGTPATIKASAFMVQGATFQADPANVGTYMFVKDLAGNILAKLPKTGMLPYSPPSLGPFDLSQLQLDTDTSGDGCYVAYV